jgi:hypothetical protein
VTPLPIAARAVPASSGIHWIVGGFRLFRQAPVMWIATVLVFLLIPIVLQYLPLVGPMLFILLYPVFFAGFMHGCKALESGQELDISHLFAGFRTRASALVTLGGMNLVAQIAAASVFILLGEERLPSFRTNGIDWNDPAAAVAALQGLVVPGLAYLLLSLPIMMAMWFAPTLLAFHDMKPLAAVKASFSACLVNLGPFSVDGIAVFALLLLVTPAVGIASMLLYPLAGQSAAIQLVMSVLLGSPVLAAVLASNYVGYRDVFQPAQG